MRIKKEDGFTLVELMITMVVFVIAMVAASNIFTGILSQFKQQSSIASSNIEGIAGLELLRHDVEQAGFGLFWNVIGTLGYNEADPNARYGQTAVSPSLYNDSGNAPRAVVVGNNVLMNGSDVLVIKATNVATNVASQKWEYITNNGALPNSLGGGSATEMLKATDHAIIINPSRGSNLLNQRVLVNSGGFDVQLNDPSFSFPPSNNLGGSVFEPPASSFTAYVAYGISDTGPLRMPFNRVDFYIKRPADIPSRCAPDTGVLYEGMVNHADGKLTELPLLDCVLDMQVVLALDANGSGSVGVGLPTDGAVLPAALTAMDIRSQLKEIRIYLIVQEGQKDISYTYVNPDAPAADRNLVYVRDPNLPPGNNGSVYGAQNGYPVPDRNYRWKLHRIVITPYNLK